MPREEILIEIGPDGNVKIEANGVKGAECAALTKDIEHALGSVTSKTLKPEHHLSPTVLRKAGA